MRSRTHSALLAVVLCASLAFPGSAPALAPSTSPMTIATEGFETPSSSWYSVHPLTVLDGTAPAWWGRVSTRAASGAMGLWCSGSGTAAWPNYAADSAGVASFDLSATADLYLSNIAFSYTMPTLGDADAYSFNALWYAAAAPANKVPHSPFALTADRAFARVTYDLTSTVNLSRTPGVFELQWQDNTENWAQTVFVGQGVTVDDVALTGWRYGPVRDLAADVTATGITLSWNRPYRAVGSTTPEERPIAYRVWRAPAATSSWTELTTTRVGDDGAAGTFTDATAVAGSAYRYVVQAWEPGSGAGYGITAEVAAARPADPVAPKVWIDAPATGAVLTGVSASFKGRAEAQPGAAIAACSMSIRRSDGVYWNGSSWQQAVCDLPVSTSDGYADWGLQVSLPADSRNFAYEISAAVTDSNGLSSATSSPVTFRIDNRGPLAKTARRTALRRVEVLFSEPLLASSVSRSDFVVVGSRVYSATLSSDRRRVELVISRPRRSGPQYVRVFDGAVSDVYGNASLPGTFLYVR